MSFNLNSVLFHLRLTSGTGFALLTFAVEMVNITRISRGFPFVPLG